MRIQQSLRYFLIAAMLLIVPAASFAQIGISITIGPPALPVYTQPPCPAPGYAWTPGYWAYGPAGYYWVPGTWVVAPVGLLWTPGYWGWGGGVYLWHAGYWGPHVGFYGGINYGYGYGGVGFAGGYWNHGAYYYNRSVTNVNVTNVTNVYNTTVVNNNTNVNRMSYNGGTGGTTAVATPLEQAAAREQHTAPLQTQVQHEQMAGNNRELLASVNHGAPSIAATARPAQFSGAGVVRAQPAGANPTPSRNTVPRPPSNNLGGAQGATRPQNNGGMNTSVPRPSPNQSSPNQTHDVPRPPSSMTRPTASPGQNSSSPRPQQQYGNSIPRPQSTPRPETDMQNRPQSNGNTPRPQSSPRPGTTMQNSQPRQAAPARESAPRPESAPRGESAPHGGEERR